MGKLKSAARLTFASSLLPGRAASPRPERVPTAMRAVRAVRARRRRGRGRGLGEPGRPSHARASPLRLLRLLRLLRPLRLSAVLTQTHSGLLLLFPLLDPAPARRAEAPPTRRGEGGPGLMSRPPSPPWLAAPPGRPRRLPPQRPARGPRPACSLCFTPRLPAPLSSRSQFGSPFFFSSLSEDTPKGSPSTFTVSKACREPLSLITRGCFWKLLVFLSAQLICPWGQNLGSGNSHCTACCPHGPLYKGHRNKDTPPNPPHPPTPVWNLDSNVVLLRELQSFSVPDFFSAAHTSKNYIPPSSNSQPTFICTLSMYPTWTQDLKKEFPWGLGGRGRQRKQKKEKETAVAFQNLFSWGKLSFYPPALLPSRSAWELRVHLC